MDSRLHSGRQIVDANLSELDTKLSSIQLPLKKHKSTWERFVTFIDRIEIGGKILPEGYMKMPRKNASYQQSIRIFYKFTGELVSEPVKEFAPNGQIPSTVPVLGEFNM